MDDVLYFRVRADEESLWRTDGTAPGTHPVTSTLLDHSILGPMVSFGGQLYFFESLPNDPTRIDSYNRSPWLYRCDIDGTHVEQIYHLSSFSEAPMDPVVVGEHLYFTLGDGYSYSDDVLWNTLGTTQTTGKLILPSVGAKHNAIVPSGKWKVGNRLVFCFNNSLWSTDGADAGTVLLKSGLTPDTTTTHVWNDSALYFNTGEDTKIAMWRTNGTVAGTKRLFVSNSYGYAHYVNRIGGDLYVSGDQGVAKYVDGTWTLVTSYAPREGEQAYVLNDQLYFAGVPDGVTPPVLLRVDGEHGTIRGVAALQFGSGAIYPGSPALKGATVYIDSNKNAKRDAGEPRVPIDTQRDFKFEGLPLGSYLVRIKLPDASFIGLSPKAMNVNLTPAPDVEVDFAATTHAKTASLEGVFFHDANKNGHQDDGEEGIEGATVYVDLDMDERHEDGEPFATSDSTGHYLISNVEGGSWILGTIYPKDYEIMDGGEIDVDLTPNQTTTRNFNSFKKPIVHGYVFFDQNLDGIRQPGETGIGKMLVKINYATSGEGGLYEHLFAKTNSAGFYSAYVEADNEFAVSAVPPSGSRSTTKAKTHFGTDGGSTTVNVGLSDQGSLSGKVFRDDDLNGSQDVFENGLSGWQVFIDSDNNGKLDAGELVKTTSPNGGYSFGSVKFGTYHLRVLPTAHSKLVATTPMEVDVKVTSGTVAKVLFGFTQRSTASGTVFEDKNDDGELSDEDRLVAGVKIFIDQNGNDKFDRGEPNATSDARGHYLIKALGRGDRLLNAVTANGWRAEGGYALIDFGSPDPANFSVTQHPLISFKAFDDKNGNGIMDGKESFSDNVTANCRLFLDLNRNGEEDFDEPGGNGDSEVAISSADPGTYYAVLEPNYFAWSVSSPKNGVVKVTLGPAESKTLIFGVKTS